MQKKKERNEIGKTECDEKNLQTLCCASQFPKWYTCKIGHMAHSSISIVDMKKILQFCITHTHRAIAAINIFAQIHPFTISMNLPISIIMMNLQLKITHSILKLFFFGLSFTCVGLFNQRRERERSRHRRLFQTWTVMKSTWTCA